MSISLWAGFECGHLGWCNQDLLVETRHTPATDMAAHYRDAMTVGITIARDGLPWRHDPASRIAAVPQGVRVIWDLCHFDPPLHPATHAIRCAKALGDGAHILAVNEPSLWPRLCRQRKTTAIAMAKRMMTAVSFMIDARFYTCDPFHHLAEQEFAATDALVATGRISVVFVNYYAHEARVPLADVLGAVARRYALPVAITETGFHDGHHGNEHSPNSVTDRRAWLAHVEREIDRSGVSVEGVCWYPFLDQPAWGRPRTRERWPCGFPMPAVPDLFPAFELA